MVFLVKVRKGGSNIINSGNQLIRGTRHCVITLVVIKENTVDPHY